MIIQGTLLWNVNPFMRVTSVLPGNKSVFSEHKNVAYDDKTVVPQFVACVHMA
jgi:hypothetical protein